LGEVFAKDGTAVYRIHTFGRDKSFEAAKFLRCARVDGIAAQSIGGKGRSAVRIEGVGDDISVKQESQAAFQFFAGRVVGVYPDEHSG
jgi:hypothetical protein